MIEALGVRYATAERFEPPEPLPWDGGWLGDFGPACPQPPGEVFMASDMRQDEDCLFLNVWTPSHEGRRPVMVWIHGGGYRQGSGDHFLSRGHVLADRGDVVVVTLNYRLGPLGFLGTADPGLLDLVCALRWVQDHIAAFGGDAANVTVFGESAGAGAVGTLLTMPAAAGLFHRAAMQSGAPWPMSAGRAQRALDALAAELGVAGLDGLRTVAVGDLVDAQQRVEAALGGLAFAPCSDGVDAAAHHAVPLIAGSNVDEVKLMGLTDPHRLDLDDARLRRRLGAELGDRFDEVVAAFARARADRGEPVTPAELYYAIRSELTFRGPTMAFADAHAAVAPTYAYLFEWRSPMLDGWLGAAHVIEIPFVFGLHGGERLRAYTGEGPDADRLSAEMMGAWVAFARGEEPWERHDPATRPTRCFGADTRTELAPREPERAAIAALRGRG